MAFLLLGLPWIYFGVGLYYTLKDKIILSFFTYSNKIKCQMWSFYEDMKNYNRY